MEDLRYPVGKFTVAGEITAAMRAEWIEQIAAAPVRLQAAIAGLSDGQLDAPYREGGWTVRQVVHHLPDSHLNAYIRFKLALTEDEPLVKPYNEAAWANLPDNFTVAPAVSLQLLEALHARWVATLRAMKPEEFKRTFRHPELGTVPLERIQGLYAWHGRHHVAHITALRERMGW
jgi:uncharacterized damage-inducible protein DinB